MKITDRYPTSVSFPRSLRRLLHVDCILTSPEQKLWVNFSRHTGNHIQRKLRCWKFIMIIISAMNEGKMTALTLLDLSSAFDTIDHSILLGPLEDWVGATGRAHDWLRSYLTGRSQQVKFGECLSRKVDLPFGVPQGSVLGRLLFTTYTTPLSLVVSQYDISHHFYDNDSQLYVSFSSRNAAVSLSSLKSCLDSVQLWMSGIINWSWIQIKRSSSSSGTSDREANTLPCSQLIFWVCKPHQPKLPEVWVLSLISTSAFVPTFQQSVAHAVTISGIWAVSAAFSLLILQNRLHTPWSPAAWITAIHFYWVLLTRR